MQKEPLITVYIPTFNRIELLKRAVKSVQGQTYQNIEIIIVDDCSTDGTHEYLEKLSKEDPRIRYFLKEKNSGACVSRNIAIENASGEFITGLDDDDYFLEDRIEIFLKNWDEKYICLFSNLLMKKSSKDIKSNYRISMKDIVNQRDILKTNYIGNQVFTKTISLVKINGFDPKMPVWQDLECWYRLLSLGQAKRIRTNSYIVDMSHPHERISNKKGKKVQAAYEYFCMKNSLDTEDRKDLMTHMTNYQDIKLDIDVYFRKLLNYRSLGNSILLFKKIFGIV